MAWIIFRTNLELKSIKINIQHKIKQHYFDDALYYVVTFKLQTAFVISYQASIIYILNSIIMKSLKEFIAEHLENSTVTTVQENNEKQVDENDNQKPIV
ncbi:hypothetical protein CMU16_14680 [Elizabethkingia anophelis]|nr:hypothetical protein [Elizabethkingia anophelis]